LIEGYSVIIYVTKGSLLAIYNIKKRALILLKINFYLNASFEKFVIPKFVEAGKLYYNKKIHLKFVKKVLNSNK